MNQQEIQGLFIKGDRALKTGDYLQAISFFEQLSQEVDPNAPNYFHIQRGLAKAYYQNQAIDQAIALCEKIIANSSSGNKLWGEQFLATITGESIAENISDLSSEPEHQKTEPPKPLRQKSLSEFKYYCQENLLPQLRELEKQRKQALISIAASGIIGILLAAAISSFITSIVKGLFSFCFLVILLCLIPIWIIYCRGCVQVYGLGFKRNIIEKIVNFIDDNENLDYAAHLFIEDSHHTKICFGRSQLFNKSSETPDFLEQEDCVFGNIGGTDVFFSEILAQRKSTVADRLISPIGNFYHEFGLQNSFLKTVSHIVFLVINKIIYIFSWFAKVLVLLFVLDYAERSRQKQRETNMMEFISQEKIQKTDIFRGLFFVAKFPKNFENRTFILPNNFANNITSQSWRGQLINLEDPDFNRLFSVHSDSQLESRYLLSTNLMDRLVKFQKKAKRNIYISFIEGHVCIAIRYYHNLFEPKLFKSMLSFAPLREYFENLQLMIGIVQDLQLNQKIWKS